MCARASRNRHDQTHSTDGQRGLQGRSRGSDDRSEPRPRGAAQALQRARHRDRRHRLAGRSAYRRAHRGNALLALLDALEPPFRRSRRQRSTSRSSVEWEQHSFGNDPLQAVGSGQGNDASTVAHPLTHVQLNPLRGLVAQRLEHRTSEGGEREGDLSRSTEFDEAEPCSEWAVARGMLVAVCSSASERGPWARTARMATALSSTPTPLRLFIIREAYPKY
jgi:hypothetical protein